MVYDYDDKKASIEVAKTLSGSIVSACFFVVSFLMGGSFGDTGG